MLFSPNCPSITAIVCKDQKMRWSALYLWIRSQFKIQQNQNSRISLSWDFLLFRGTRLWLTIVTRWQYIPHSFTIQKKEDAAHRHPNLSTNGNRNVFSSDCIGDFICTSLCNDSVQAGKTYIFITAPARWTVKTFIVPLFGRKTLLVTSISVAPDQTKTLNTL